MILNKKACELKKGDIILMHFDLEVLEILVDTDGTTLKVKYVINQEKNILRVDNNFVFRIIDKL